MRWEIVKLFEVLSYQVADSFGVDDDLVFKAVLGIGVGVGERNIGDTKTTRFFLSCQFLGIAKGEIKGRIIVNFPI